MIRDLGDGITVVTAYRHGNGDQLELADAMIFNSSDPTGDDYDLGTPHESVGGPGQGAGGRQGQPFANVVARGQILIISEDGFSSDPDDEAAGGLLDFTFARPLYIRDIGLLDNEEGVRILAITSDGQTKEIDVPGRGNNSFETVSLRLSNVVVLSIDFFGSAALTHIKASVCRVENAPVVSNAVPPYK
jgi:hypothetical protein